MTDAGWHADPTGRFDHRYWNGSEWTEHVSTNGVQSVDPLTLATPLDTAQVVEASRGVPVAAESPSVGDAPAEEPAPIAPAPVVEPRPSDKPRGFRGWSKRARIT